MLTMAQANIKNTQNVQARKNSEGAHLFALSDNKPEPTNRERTIAMGKHNWGHGSVPSENTKTDLAIINKNGGKSSNFAG